MMGVIIMKVFSKLKVVNKLKAICSKIRSKWSTFKENNYGDTEKGKILLFNLLGSIIVGCFFINSGLPEILSFLLFSFLAFLGINLLRIIVTLLLKPLFHDSTKSAVYTIMIFLFMFFVILAGSFVVPIPLIFIISIVITALEILFAKSLWSFFRHKRRSIPVILSFSITFLINIMLGWILWGEGFEDEYIKGYLEIGNVSNDVTLNDQISIENGDLSVSQLEYGRNEDLGLTPGTTDLTSYIDNYAGISSTLRGLYWGYDIDQVPLAGKVWYPSEGGNYPVVFIIHGNHIMTTQSYLGYDYLGEYLASNGYVVVSVDESFCNAYINLGLSNENDARAYLLLENMRIIEAYNNNQDSPLFEKMNFENIALAGHSRGGESVATAALFNNYSYYPENGNIRWDYNFHIKSLIAIAPTCDQYQPAEHEVQLSDVNYLLIHGTNDQDVVNIMGYNQYHNITYSKQGDYFKTYVYIAGANHGQFNTKWGRYDLPYPMKPFLNTDNLIAAKEQRNLLKKYTKAFLDVTLKNDDTQKVIFTDYKTNQKALPDNLLIQNYQDSTFDLICGFDEDSNLKLGAADNTFLNARNMSVWKEEKNPITPLFDDYALYLEWKETREAAYSIQLLDYNAQNGYLQFDIMDINQQGADSDKIQLLDATITLEDSQGNISSLHMRDYATIYPPLPVKLYKFQFLTNTYDYKLCFQTVRLLCKEFETMNKEFDSSSIVKISFHFNKNESGKVMVDNIGFGK